MKQKRKPGRRTVGSSQGQARQFPLRLYDQQILAAETLCERNPAWSMADALRHLINQGIANEPGLGEQR